MNAWCPAQPSGPADGVIKYTADHHAESLPQAPDFLALLAQVDTARTRLHKVGLIGVDAGGTGYGNLSARLSAPEAPPSFLISGSGTGRAPVLGADGYCRVMRCELESNRVISAGPVRASSESMSHYAVYQAKASARFVVHVHHQGLFAALLREGWPHTPGSVAYGTPEMAYAVAELVRKTPGETGLFVSAGHAEGLFAYSADLDAAVDKVLTALEQYCGMTVGSQCTKGEA